VIRGELLAERRMEITDVALLVTAIG